MKTISVLMKEVLSSFKRDVQPNIYSTEDEHSYKGELLELLYFYVLVEPKLIGEYTVSCEEIEGGQDQGSYFHYVFRIANDGQVRFGKIAGAYDSYEGTDFLGSRWEEVYPTTVKVIQYLNKSDIKRLDKAGELV